MGDLIVSKVDYRDLLSPEDFAVYAKLRDLRKEIAQRETVPVYTVFTNAQLAQMVQRRVTSRADLAEIEGVGEARVEKYASRMLEILKQQWTQPDEAGEQLVPTDRKPR